ncbi:MAG: selenide, water dikinase SelD [Proteobacteria bacterium]|nr:selenide, water dikinase SelD [Pseudomonadota bacterium]
MQAAIPLTRDLVLIGGGHTHALVLRMWGMAPLPGARLTLISPAPTAAYSGMLPGHVAGHYPREALEIDLVKLARFAGARLILGHAEGIDRQAQRVIVPGRADVAYDVASIDIGISSGMPDLPGFADHAVPAKPLDVFAAHWARFLREVRAGRRAPTVAVIGGGVAGVELALAAKYRLGEGAKVAVIEAAAPLALLGKGAQRALFAHLDQAGVLLLAGLPAVGVDAVGVTLADGRQVAADFVIGAAGTRPAPWLAETGLELAEGFVAIGETLQSVTDPAIFASGDVAAMVHASRPKAGVFAVRQAPVLHENLKVALTGQGRMRPYHPQRDYLKLISTGHRAAVADKWGLRLDGAALWRWKDRIDRAFMAKFSDLPEMEKPKLPEVMAAGVRETLGEKPLCAGCGAKVGFGDLASVLADLPRVGRPDVLLGAGDDAAVLAAGKGYQVLTTDHLRAFTEDPWLLSRITAIHALGDVWSMGARPQAALSQVILPRMAPKLQRETLREIMAAAAEVFAAEGAEIVGGHTTMGAEMTVGFTVTGLAANAPITLSGAKPGDWLILTKPIGTGVILAAEMLRAAPGDVVAACLRSMARPQGAAARILAPHAHAMTDVTGFGLAGHLLEMMTASRAAAHIDLTFVPLLSGAEALSASGHGSTILPANRAAAARMFWTESPRAELLFDPQTSGGLLAAVPASHARDIVARLRDAGEAAAIIGAVEEGEAFLTVEN